MKKLFSILLVAMLIVTSLATVAFAAGSATVSASSATAKAGDEVTISFTLSGSQFANYGMQVTADPVLTLIGISQGPASNGAFVGNSGNGVVGFGATYNCNGGVIFTATFKVSADAKPGTYPVSVNMDYVADANMDDLSVSVVAGYVTVVCDHAWGEWNTVEAASCTKEGKAERICSVCKEVETKVLPMLAHNWSAWKTVVEPTCTAAGKAERTCSVGGEVETKELAKLGHEASDEWSHDDDYHWHACCNGCNEVFDKGEHVMEWVITKNPTHNTTGLKHLECKVCGYSLADEEIPEEPNLDPVPGTGDITPMVYSAVLVILSVVFVIAFLVKRMFTRHQF